MSKKLHYDEIRVSEGTDVNKKKTPKECTICIFQIKDLRFKQLSITIVKMYL